MQKGGEEKSLLGGYRENLHYHVWNTIRQTTISISHIVSKNDAGRNRGTIVNLEQRRWRAGPNSSARPATTGLGFFWLRKALRTSTASCSTWSGQSLWVLKSHC